MDIRIHNACEQPIYEQIYTQIRNTILSGELAAGDPLPSIRALAKDLRISVITTKRAYDELERSGYICTVAGKGCYVAEKNTEILRQEHRRQIADLLRQAVRLAPGCRLTAEDLAAMLRRIEQEERESDTDERD